MALTTEKKHALVVVAVAVAIALPVVILPYPPMTDLPHHEALVALLRNFGDPSLFPPGLYVRNLGQPNQLFHLLAWPLSYVMGVTLATKVVAALAVASVPLGAARLAAHLGATRLTALALVPVSLGWLFVWGFVNNLLGLGIFFAMLPSLDRFAESPSRRSFLPAVAGALLLYLAHELVMFVYVGAALMFALLRAPSIGGFVLRASPAFIALTAAGVQIVLQEKLKTGTIQMVPNVWLPVTSKIIEIPSVVVGGADRAMRLLTFGLLVAFVAYLAGLRRRSADQPDGDLRPASVGRLARARAWATGRRFELLGLSSFGLYIVAPFTFNGAMLVHERFLAPAVGLFALTAGVRVAPRLPAIALGLSLPLASAAMLLPWFGDASRNYRDMEALFEEIPPMSSVAAVDLDLNQGGRPFTVASGLSRVLVRRGGRVLYSFAESTVAPVRLAPAHQWNEPPTRIMFDNLKLRPAHDLQRFGYLLVHTTEPGNRFLIAAALMVEAELVTSQGDWALYKSRLPVASLDAPDVPLPMPPPETLGRRLDVLQRSILESPREAQEAP